MITETRQRVYDLLADMPKQGLSAAKQLFWTELNYDRANDPLSRRPWSDRVREVLAEDPVVLANHGDFDIIYATLAEGQVGRSFPLSLTAERLTINQLLKNHPYALFLFSDLDEEHWHLVNVRYDEDEERRRVFRRIAVGPHERLRTAAERVAMLDLTILSPDLTGLSPLAIQQRHDEAFDVEAVTQDFFATYRAIFKRAETHIAGLDGDTRRLFVQKLFNRMMFIIFLERKGWLTLNGRDDYLQALWVDHQREKREKPDVNFYRDRLKPLFFSGLNTPNDVNVVGTQPDGFLQSRIGDVPYLNGGLFEETQADRASSITVPDNVIEPALDKLFYRYNFTVVESTPLDIEVAVDPEMLGKIFEELVTGRHETGSYYTPKQVVAFMSREALKGYLQAVCDQESSEAVTVFVDKRNPEKLRDSEAVLAALTTVRICDPACGSGAYLLGALHELLALRTCLFATRGLDPLTAYQRKLEIIQNNLYGVDSDPFAVNIARLRLWLSLVVDFQDGSPPPLPNLDFKIEVGDSLTAPDPTGGLETGFRKELVERFFKLKAEYLMTHGSEKLTLRQEIGELRAEIASWAGRERDTTGFDWLVEFAEVFTPSFTKRPTLSSDRAGGFDIVLTNPPYVRADAQYQHIQNEEERQAAIARWQRYRKSLKKSKTYETLYEKWDLYIPFLERAYQLLRPSGQMVFIVSDAYNAAKYSRKSHRFFLNNARVIRLDFCSEIPLFKAGIDNTIVHFEKAASDDIHLPLRFRRWGDRADDFEYNVKPLRTAPQVDFGRALFRSTGQKPMEVGNTFVALENICYTSVGMVVHADERGHQGEFSTEDVLSSQQDDLHPKRFVLGKDIRRWTLNNVRYLEWGTSRAPAHFRRPTFPELHEAKEKLIAMRTPGPVPKVVYDDNHLHFDASSVGFVPWHYLKGVVNRSISMKAKYKSQSPEGDREKREDTSREFHTKYLLAVMNSTFAKDWLARKRRSKRHIYPNDWKKLPIAPISMKQQQGFVRLVDIILAQFAQYGPSLPKSAAARVADLEQEIDRLVAELYEVDVT